jgi:fructan beta-fructosidase
MKTTVNLVVDGKVVSTATGPTARSWTGRRGTSPNSGRQASIKVVDNNRFGWGHILADEFTPPAPATPRVQSYDWLDYGRDYYASVSFNNMPQDKRIMLGWMNNWDYANNIPTSPGAAPCPCPAKWPSRRRPAVRA